MDITFLAKSFVESVFRSNDYLAVSLIKEN